MVPVCNYFLGLNYLLLWWLSNGDFENSIIPSTFISGTSYCKKNFLYLVYGIHLYQHGRMGSCFIQWVITCFYPDLFLCELFQVWPSSWLRFPIVMIYPSLSTCFTLWHKMSQAHLFCLLLRWETKMRTLGVLIGLGCHCSQALCRWVRDYVGELCACMCANTHIYISLEISRCAM